MPISEAKYRRRFTALLSSVFAVPGRYASFLNPDPQNVKS
jgi:hypothetical protein